MRCASPLAKWFALPAFEAGVADCVAKPVDGVRRLSAVERRNRRIRAAAPAIGRSEANEDLQSKRRRRIDRSAVVRRKDQRSAVKYGRGGLEVPPKRRREQPRVNRQLGPRFRAVTTSAT
jgi:hypothetical protein